VSYPLPLTPAQIEAAMQLLTIQLLGIPAPSVPNDPAYSAVRVSWQQQGQPAELDISTDVTFLRCVEIDDQYNRVRDVQTTPNDSLTVNQVTSYIRVWQTSWVSYGPNAFDNTRKIKTGLFTQVVHDTFIAKGLALALVTSLEAPRRLPEPRDGGQWWERVDFDAKFNEQVTEVVVIGSVASTEIVLETAAGIVADIVVQGD
jgi:hypothetical protein